MVKKVRVAQQMGAHAVLIADGDSGVDEDRIIDQIPFTDEDVSGLTAPSILISQANGLKLATEAEARIAKAASGENQGIAPLVRARLEWDVPDQAVVQFHLWMQSGHAQTVRFLRDFATTAESLGEQLAFHPHFTITRAKEIQTLQDRLLQSDLVQCIGPYVRCEGDDPLGTPTEEGSCERPLPPRPYKTEIKLTDTDLFCSKDPDGEGPIVGSDVVQQDLLELCIWSEHHAPGKYDQQFWDFVKELPQECPLESNFNSKCGHELLDKLQKKFGTYKVDDVLKCEAEAESKLAYERANRAWGPPAVTINHWRYSGPLDAQEVVRALCLGFAKDKQPKTCTDFTKKNPDTDAHGTSFTEEEIRKTLEENKKTYANIEDQIALLIKKYDEVKNAPVAGPSTGFFQTTPGASWAPGPVATTTVGIDLLAPAGGTDSDLMKYLPFGVLFIAVLCVSVAFGMVLQARLMQTAIVADMRLQPAQRTPLLERNGDGACNPENNAP